MERKLLSIIAVFATMMILGTSIALATDPNFGGEGNFNSGDVCGGATQVDIIGLQVLTDDPATANFDETGYRLLVVDGPHHQGFHRVDEAGNSVMAELDTILPAGTYLVAPDVRGTGWTYAVGCDPTDMVLAHIERRVNDPSVNTQGTLVTTDLYPDEIYALFVPVNGSVNTTADFGDTPDPATATTVEATQVTVTETTTEQNPPDSNGVITSGGFDDEDYSSTDDPTTQPVGDPYADETLGSDPTAPTVDDMSNSELCADDYADELSETLGVERNNRDFCNDYAGVEANCVIGYERYPLDRLPELSNSGAGNIFTVKNYRGQAVISWFPHGRLTFQPGPTGNVWDAGIFCTYDQIMGWIQANMQRLGVSEYLDWQDIKFLNFDTYNIPGGYYGGTEDPDTAVDCRPIGEKRIFEQIRKGYIDAKGFFIHGSPWVSGVSKERQVVIRPRDLENGNLYWDPSVQGSVRLYPADRCNFDQVMEQARVHHHARGKAHSDLVVANWRTDPFTSTWFSIR